MLDYNINYVGVLAAAVVAFIVSFVWWGPLFGKKWAMLTGMTKDEMKRAKEKSMVGPMIVAFIANLVMAYVLAVLLISMGAATYGAAVMLAFWVWFGFVATIGIGVVLWQNKPMSLFWMNSIGWLIVLAIMSLVLTAL